MIAERAVVFGCGAKQIHPGTAFRDKNIERFAEETGVPVLLNTSFNLRGEPIVNTPENALNTFGKSGIDALYIENFIVRK